MLKPIYLAPICLPLEEVAVFVGREVLMEVGNDNSRIGGDQHGILVNSSRFAQYTN